MWRTWANQYKELNNLMDRKVTSKKKRINDWQSMKRWTFSFGEKVSILQVLRDRSVVLRGSLFGRCLVAQLCPTLWDPWTVAHQAPPSLGFSRQEQWSGLPFPSPRHESEKWKWSLSVVSESSKPHGLQPTRLLWSMGVSRQGYWSGVPLPSPPTSTVFSKTAGAERDWHKFWLILTGFISCSWVPACPVGFKL